MSQLFETKFAYPFVQESKLLVVSSHTRTEVIIGKLIHIIALVYVTNLRRTGSFTGLNHFFQKELSSQRGRGNLGEQNKTLLMTAMMVLGDENMLLLVESLSTSPSLNHARITREKEL